jgi:hypothetical protein
MGTACRLLRLQYRWSVVLRRVQTTSRGVVPMTARSVVSRMFAASVRSAGSRAGPGGSAREVAGDGHRADHEVCRFAARSAGD